MEPDFIPMIPKKGLIKHRQIEPYDLYEYWSISNGEGSGSGSGDGDFMVGKHGVVDYRDSETVEWEITEESGDEGSIIVIRANAAAQVQSDWEQSDSGEPDYIKNKPEIPEQVQSDWEQSDTGEPDYIKNKPEIPEIPENIISGVTDGVWDLDMTAGNLKVSPYAARTSGGFDSGSVHPNEYTRLNWNGMFYARTLQSNGINYLSRGVIAIGGNGTVDYPALVTTTWDTNVEIYCYKNGSTHGGWGWQTVPIYIGCVNAHTSVFNNAEWIKIDDEQQLFEVFMTHIKFSKGLPVYDDNAAAVAAGLATNSLYRKTTGEVMIVY